MSKSDLYFYSDADHGKILKFTSNEANDGFRCNKKIRKKG